MENILEIKNLTKSYSDFKLDNINISLPKGCIMGFVGENGAGKSTTINLMLNLLHRDSGDIKIFGKDNIKNEQVIKQDLGVVLDESSFPDNMTPKDIGYTLKNIYKNWNDKTYANIIKRFSLPLNKKVKAFSKGMKMKLSISAALSHDPKLLILDEATSGLDPIVRDEILDVFLDFLQDEEHGIFISTHIISDLEKIADYIALIHKGKMLFNETKDNLLCNYGVLKCTQSEFHTIDKSIVVGSRIHRYGVEALILKKKLRTNLQVDNATIEDIMLYHIRGN